MIAPAILNRRQFLGTVSASLLAAPLVADAQPPAKFARIGPLTGSGALDAARRSTPGWSEGTRLH